MQKNWIINNQYLVIEKLGAGGIATVYKAWDNMLQKFVAIKKIHEEYSTDAKYVDMFRREAVNTAKLEHENIVRVLSFIKDIEGNFYIIMDYVKGLDLEFLLDKCRRAGVKIPVEISLFIIAEAIKGLDYAHTLKDPISGKSLNLVHRDVSPGNVMVYYDGRIKLTDFGIAMVGEQQIPVDGKKKLKGKISYMSPEQAMARTDIDARSDLFGCGLILYGMLTGEKAFAGKDDVDTWRKAKDANVNFKRLIESGVPPEIHKFLEKALQKLPENRYQSAVEMFIDLKRYLSKNVGTEEVLRKRHKDFIESTLGKEIEDLKESMKKDSEKDFRRIFTLNEAAEAESQGKVAKTPGDVSIEEKMPTVEFQIKNNKESIKVFQVLRLIFIALIIFAIMDIYMQLTVFGTKIHAGIWPPVLKIDSIPTRAGIELIKNNVDIIKKGGYRPKTPVYIEKIQPGVYTLKLSNEKYGQTVKKVTVFGKQKGSQSISITGAKLIDGIYIVPFDVAIEINSIPSEAVLFIDGNKVGQTPFKGSLEIGQHNFYLVKSGFGVLGIKNPELEYGKGICVIDTFKSADEQTKIDYNFWDINETKTDKGEKKIILSGTLYETQPL